MLISCNKCKSLSRRSHMNEKQKEDPSIDFYIFSFIFSSYLDIRTNAPILFSTVAN